MIFVCFVSSAAGEGGANSSWSQMNGSRVPIEREFYEIQFFLELHYEVRQNYVLFNNMRRVHQ